MALSSIVLTADRTLAAAVVRLRRQQVEGYMNEGIEMVASGAAAAAIAEASKASGVIVRVEPADFLAIVEMNPEPLVVCALGGFFSTNYQYLTSYRGLAFFTKAEYQLRLPSTCQTIRAQKIWIPG